MPELKSDGSQSSRHSGLQAAIDAMDVIGRWELDIPNGLVRADTLVALISDVDPDDASAGAPLSDFTARIHPDDRERILALIQECSRRGSHYVADYRVCSADGRTRWLLARGHFETDSIGHPLRGHGIVVDITQTRLGERACVAASSSSSDACSGLDATRPALERVTEHLLAAREAAGAIDNRRLHVLLDMILVEIGRGFDTLQRSMRRKFMQ